jgi:hypothetical protein
MVVWGGKEIRRIGVSAYRRGSETEEMFLTQMACRKAVNGLLRNFGSGTSFASSLKGASVRVGFN